MPRAVDHDQRRAEIVQNARDLIGERGVDALTLRNLADRCGFANGAIRRYFRFKRDVFVALDEDIVRRVREHADRSGYQDQRGPEALRTLLDSVLPLDRERVVSAAIFAALRDHALWGETFAVAFNDRLDQLFARVVLHLEEAHADGQLSGDRSIDVSAAILVNTVVGINVTSSIGEERRLAQFDAAAIGAIIETA